MRLLLKFSDFVVLVSNVSADVYGESHRNQRVLATIASRSVLPVAKTKSDYAEYMGN